MQQPMVPSANGPMILVRTADNKYGLAPADNPTRLLVSGEGIRAQDDVQVSGPGSQALAYQRFLLTRQGQFAPGNAEPRSATQNKISQEKENKSSEKD